MDVGCEQPKTADGCAKGRLGFLVEVLKMSQGIILRKGGVHPPCFSWMGIRLCRY